MYYRSILLLVTIIFTSSIVTIGQQQPQNPDFEEWEDVGIHPDTLEPVNWSSLKTSDGGDLINAAIPVGWFQSEDAHSGMYSVKLLSNNHPIQGVTMSEEKIRLFYDTHIVDDTIPYFCVIELRPNMINPIYVIT